MRKASGYGSVYRLKGRRRKPWVARVPIEWTSKGKLIRKYIGYYETRQEALIALAEYHKNPVGFYNDTTLGDLYEKWFDLRYGSGDKSDKIKTIKMYQTARTHLDPIADMMVADIKTSHLQSIISTMQHDKNLSYSSCHKVKVLMNQLFKAAVADDIINKNYAETVELPPRKAQKHKTFSDMEVKTLEKHAAGIEWVDTILIFIYSGMRIEELLSLTKFNIDIEQKLFTGGLKTQAGKNRIIPIHSKIQKYVMGWYNKDGSEYLIHRNGEKIRQDYYRKYIYYPALEQLGIRKLTPHKARHTFATMLHRARVPQKDIQLLLGHADYSTTANIYTHVNLAELRKSIERIG